MVDAIINAFNTFRDYLYLVLKFYQHLTEPFLGSQSYWFSIVLLTISVRVILIPLTIKQVRASRAMSDLAPEIKKLQAKYKNDREKLSQEMMALYKERGANPASGCLPILAQAPFFLALYRVIFSPTIDGEPNILIGQKFFGVPLQTHWMQLEPWTEKIFSLSGIVILTLIILMGATTFISQRQLLARQAEVNPQQRMLMRIMPIMFAVFAVNFPLAVIIYWVTTNLWSMGQQYILLRDRPVVAEAGANGTGKSGPGGGTKRAPSGGGKTGSGAAKPAPAGERPRGGLLSSFSSLLRPAATDEGASNGSGSKSSSKQDTSQKPSTNGKASGGGAKPAAKAQGGSTPQAKKSSTAARKPGSPPRSGGGKSSARGGQRRRKR